MESHSYRERSGVGNHRAHTVVLDNATHDDHDGSDYYYHHRPHDYDFHCPDNDNDDGSDHHYDDGSDYDDYESWRIRIRSEHATS